MYVEWKKRKKDHIYKQDICAMLLHVCHEKKNSVYLDSFKLACLKMESNLFMVALHVTPKN